MRGRRTRTDAPTSLHGCEQNSARGRQTVLRMHLSRAGPRRPFVASTRHTRIRRWGTWPASSRKRSLAAGRTWRRPSASSHRASVSDSFSVGIQSQRNGRRRLPSVRRAVVASRPVRAKPQHRPLRRPRRAGRGGHGQLPRPRRTGRRRRAARVAATWP